MMPPVAILAGGLGTRMYPVTKDIPKALLEVAGHPFIFHQLALVRSKGITDVVLCTGFLGEQIRDVVKDGGSIGVRVQYSFDGDQLLGTGGALRKALPMLGDMFWVLYGDSYLDFDYKPMYEQFAASDKIGMMSVFENRGKWDTSNVLYRDNTIIAYDKNPAPGMKHIDYGLSLLRKAALEDIPEGTPVDLAEIYADLVRRGEMAGYEVHKRFYEAGSQKGLKELDDYLKNTGSPYKPG